MISLIYYKLPQRQLLMHNILYKYNVIKTNTNQQGCTAVAMISIRQKKDADVGIDVNLINCTQIWHSISRLGPRLLERNFILFTYDHDNDLMALDRTMICLPLLLHQFLHFQTFQLNLPFLFMKQDFQIWPFVDSLIQLLKLSLCFIT